MKILKKIDKANPYKGYGNIERRGLKLGEEAGELADALLDATKPGGMTQKNIEHVIEEAADTLIIAVDIALTFGTREDLSQMIDKKLEKWKTQIAEKRDVTLNGQSIDDLAKAEHDNPYGDFY